MNTENLTSGHKGVDYDVFDPTFNDSLIITDPNYIPYSRVEAYTKSSFITLPPDYAESNIMLSFGTLERHSIPILFLGEVSEARGANFIRENPVGSTFPILAFSNTTDTQISVMFHVLADYIPQGYFSFQHYINIIRRMTMPLYSGEDVIAPEVYVTLPGFAFQGVCDSLSFSYSPIYGNNEYSHVQVSCTFTINAFVGT